MKVEKIVNISTISAFRNSKSIYGRTKFKIEEDSKKYNVINLRPGLFFGSNSKFDETNYYHAIKLKKQRHSVLQ